MRCNICDGMDVGDKKSTIKHFYTHHPTLIIPMLKEKGVIE